MPSSFSSDLRYIKKNKQLFLSQWRCHFGSKPTDPRSIAVVAETCSTLQSSTKRERERRKGFFFFFLFSLLWGIEYLLLQPRSAPKDASDQLMLKELRPNFRSTFFLCVWCTLWKKERNLFFSPQRRTPHTQKRQKTKDKKLPCDPLHAKQSHIIFGFCCVFFFWSVLCSFGGTLWGVVLLLFFCSSSTNNHKYKYTLFFCFSLALASSVLGGTRFSRWVVTRLLSGFQPSWPPPCYH